VTPAGLGARRDELAAVLDTLIPAADGFPESGGLALDHVLAIASASNQIGALLARALDAIDEATRAGGTRGFAERSAAEREELLRRLERSHPEAFEALVRHTYDGFYSHPATIARLGLEPGPVQPRGHRIEPAPAPDVARVAARGPIYRQA